MKYLSTFSGIGGFELGIQQAYEISNLGRITSSSDTKNRRHLPLSDYSNGDGRRSDSNFPECIGFSEIDKYATSIYQKHFPEHKNYGDVTRINANTLPDFDLLVGGFPCQTFSIAGKRRGFEDTRGTMFFELARILRAKQPRLFVFENVKGLLSHDNGNTFKIIIATLDELGYDLQWQVLNSKNHGVPQNRERVFIIGHLRGTSRPQVFPIIRDSQPTATVAGYISETDWPRRHEQIRRVYKTDGAMPTIPTGQGGGVMAKILTDDIKIRRLTPKECERLQGFPDDWTVGVSDTQRYKCCGNAVTVNVIRDIMVKLL